MYFCMCICTVIKAKYRSNILNAYRNLKVAHTYVTKLCRFAALPCLLCLESLMKAYSIYPLWVTMSYIRNDLFVAVHCSTFYVTVKHWLQVV